MKHYTMDDVIDYLSETMGAEERRAVDEARKTDVRLRHLFQQMESAIDATLTSFEADDDYVDDEAVQAMAEHLAMGDTQDSDFRLGPGVTVTYHGTVEAKARPSRRQHCVPAPLRGDDGQRKPNEPRIVRGELKVYLGELDDAAVNELFPYGVALVYYAADPSKLYLALVQALGDGADSGLRPRCITLSLGRVDANMLDWSGHVEQFSHDVVDAVSIRDLCKNPEACQMLIKAIDELSGEDCVKFAEHRQNALAQLRTAVDAAKQ